MNLDDLKKENLSLKQSVSRLTKFNKHYKFIIKKSKSYILHNSTYELPNEWSFHGDISFVLDLLSISAWDKK